jgi:type 1 glutamine amidotransferase
LPSTLEPTRETPIHVLLLMGDAHHLHDQPVHYAELSGMLAGEGGVDLRITRDLSILNRAQLETVDVVVNSTTFVEATPGQIDALLNSVRGGTGFVALHGGNATFWNSARYLRMLGSRFLNHDQIKRFSVHIEEPSHPIVTGVGDFEIEDELFELGGDASQFEDFTEAFRERGWAEDVVGLGAGPLPPDTTLLASAEHRPLLYTRMYGRGRVHYNALGHDERALRNSSYRRLVVQGVNWTAQANLAVDTQP